MNNNKPINSQLHFKKTAIAVTSVLALLSLSANAVDADADSSANAGPLGAAAAAAAGNDDSPNDLVKASTGNAGDSLATESDAPGYGYGNGTSNNESASASAGGLVDTGDINNPAAGRAVDYQDDPALNVLVDNDSGNVVSATSSPLTATVSNLLGEVVDEDDDDIKSFAGAAVSEARSSIENKIVNNDSNSAVSLTSSSISATDVDVYTYDSQTGSYSTTDGTEAQAAAAAAAASFSSAVVKQNTINNTGSISTNAPPSKGILLDANSSATADAYANAEADVYDLPFAENNDDNDSRRGNVDASADAESYAEAIVQSNTINNTGNVTAVDAAIALQATSAANSTAVYVENGSSLLGDSDSWAVSKIIDNVINNSATLSADKGILLLSEATATDNEGSNDNIATSNVDNNIINNSGTINSDTAGISIRSVSVIDNTDPLVTNIIGESESTVDFNTLINTGNILTVDGVGVELYASSSGGSEAVSYIRNNTITNSGIISADSVLDNTYITINSNATDDIASNDDGGGAGQGADGIRLRALADEFRTEGSNLDGANIGNNAINNTGKIYAIDDGIDISASDGPDFGIFAGRVLSGNQVEGRFVNAVVSDNAVNNSYGGRIVAGDVGINISADYVQRNTINNSGLIVSDPGMSLNGANLTKSDRALWDANNANAIRFAGWADNSFNTNNVEPEGTQNFLNLNAPGYLAGRIMLRAESDVNVTLTSGVSHSVRWAIQNDNDYAQENQSNAYTWAGGDTTRAALNGPNPWFVNEVRVPGEDALNDINGRTNDIYATIDPSAFSAAANMLADLSGMVSTMAKTGMNQTGEKNGVWIAANGTRMDYDGDKRATMDQDTRVMGGSIGYTHHFDGFKAGVMAGYSDAELQVGSFYRDLYKHSYDNDIRGGFAGVYGNTDIGWLNVNVGLSGGRLNHDDKRFVNDNLKWWGISYAKADYDSTWYSPEVTLSVPFEAGEGFTITPNLHLQYTKQNIDSYTEKGSNSDARVASRDIAVSEVKAGLDVSKTIGMARFMGRVGYLNRNSHGDNSVRVTMIGDTQDVPFFYQDINAVYVGAGVNINLGDRVDFNLSGNYLTGKDFDNGGNVTGMLRFKY